MNSTFIWKKVHFSVFSSQVTWPLKASLEWDEVELLTSCPGTMPGNLLRRFFFIFLYYFSHFKEWNTDSNCFGWCLHHLFVLLFIILESNMKYESEIEGYRLELQIERIITCKNFILFSLCFKAQWLFSRSAGFTNEIYLLIRKNINHMKTAMQRHWELQRKIHHTPRQKSSWNVRKWHEAVYKNIKWIITKWYSPQ